jgi:ADP-heptose:LPS heptosyltransferase
MNAKNNIVEQIRARIAKMAQESPRGVILQPGGIGDCILTLPLAEYMKEAVCKGGVDIIGHTEYIGILPGRSCVDAVRSMDSMELHRLFEKKEEFELAEPDESGLIMSFADYTWIVTFLGGADSDFEQNLIFTANCSHSAEVMVLEMKPKEGGSKHISDFYREQFITQSGVSGEERRESGIKPLIKATQADRNSGREILDEAGVSQTDRPVIIHPGSGGAHKCWNIDNFLAIAKMLTSKGAEAVFVLGPAEEERFDDLTRAKIRVVAKVLANLSLREVVSVMSCARGYLGNDSGITHLAAALGLPTAAIFGPTEPAVYGPLGPAVTILRSKDADFTTAVSEELQEKAVAALMQNNPD